MTEISYAKCLDDLKKLGGISPYDGINPDRGAGYFANWIYTTYPKDMLDKANEELDRMQDQWSMLQDQFLRENRS